ncbi:MAG TPA: TadE/TadG family type IV pilus assembly protein [Phenylobacterium sp.]|nr:TadE/TadG family type IV pilus assembly protein [Phenylobacterium sp.]
MSKIEPHAARIRAFRADQNGTAAIEFAIIAPVLFFTLLSLVELGVLGMMTSALDNAVVEVSRRIRTGGADAATSASSFEDQICDRMGGAITGCRDRLTISVQKFSAFSSAGAAASAPPAGQFDKGGANDIVLVKADYRWPLMTPFVATAYNRDGPLEVTIAARAAFKNEPFQ